MTDPIMRDREVPDASWPDTPWGTIAARALVEAAGDGMDIAAGAVQHLAREHGVDGLNLAMLGWIDVSWTRLYPDGLPEGLLAAPTKFWWTGRAEPVHTGEVTAAERWAGRLVLARLAGDEQQTDELLASVEDDRQRAAHAVALLEVCAPALQLAWVDW